MLTFTGHNSHISATLFLGRNGLTAKGAQLLALSFLVRWSVFEEFIFLHSVGIRHIRGSHTHFNFIKKSISYHSSNFP